MAAARGPARARGGTENVGGKAWASAATATDATFRRLREIKRMSTTAVQQGRGRRGPGRATGGATEAQAAPLNRQQLTMYSMMTRTSIPAAATVTTACRLL